MSDCSWLEALSVLWSWPTLVAGVVVAFRQELRALLNRFSTASRARLGSLEFELRDPGNLTQPMPREVVSGKTFSSQTIEIDGKSFDNCVFNDVTLVYKATGTVGFTYCRFSDVRWEVAGHAALTLNLLAAVYSGMGEAGRQLIENTFESIRKGQVHGAA